MSSLTTYCDGLYGPLPEGDFVQAPGFPFALIMSLEPHYTFVYIFKFI